MKIQVLKYSSGLSQVQVDGRLLLDGATGRVWQGHTTELAGVVKAIHGWNEMKVAGEFVIGEPAAEWIVGRYKEF